jgi:alkaline phosphatase
MPGDKMPVLIFALSLLACSSLSLAEKPGSPLNVIVMISDGSGFNHILATDYYQYGEAGSQVYESFPVSIGMSTWSTNTIGYNPQKRDNGFYTKGAKPTDSAASATAMSCSVKTYNGAIGVDSKGLPVEHLIELAEKLGKSSGVVSSVPVSHATPAGFCAHSRKRSNYESIAREMIGESRLEVIMGCGHPDFDENGKLWNDESKPEIDQQYKYVGGKSFYYSFRESLSGADADGDGVLDPWTFIDTKLSFENLAFSKAICREKRVFGLVPVKSTLQVGRDSDSDENSSDGQSLPFSDSMIDTVPDLVTMAAGALRVLQQNDSGFFLMIEGGAIDWASHGNNSARMIEEEIAFNHTVEYIVDWIENNSSWRETLLIVTADHECGNLSGPGAADYITPVVNNGKGKLPLMEWRDTHHTNRLVPFFAKGPGFEHYLEAADSLDPVHGSYIDNVELPAVVFDLWR